ncbi:unnamed protein product [Protopolystoma xenopodis]|uniref:Uncharacterized protein n=1 Tax=Protopolystoma xenopodis TaxID=117903 RepID=A0A448WM40_9PLAT|nr:unnamed protein product [Protopolystoma xenopodis]
MAGFGFLVTFPASFVATCSQHKASSCSIFVPKHSLSSPPKFSQAVAPSLNTPCVGILDAEKTKASTLIPTCTVVPTPSFLQAGQHTPLLIDNTNADSPTTEGLAIVGPSCTPFSSVDLTRSSVSLCVENNVMQTHENSNLVKISVPDIGVSASLNKDTKPLQEDLALKLLHTNANGIDTSGSETPSLPGKVDKSSIVCQSPDFCQSVLDAITELHTFLYRSANAQAHLQDAFVFCQGLLKKAAGE